MNLIATHIDHFLTFTGSILAVLIGYRLIGPRPGKNAKLDKFHRRLGRHLKWLGPLGLACLIADILLPPVFLSQRSGMEASVMKDYGRSAKETADWRDGSSFYKAQTFQDDKMVTSPFGYQILIPAGYTFSRKGVAPFDLFAIYGAKESGATVFSVLVTPLEVNIDHTIANRKAVRISDNEKTKFSEFEITRKDATKFYRAAVYSEKSGEFMMGGIIIFEKDDKAFFLEYQTSSSLFGENQSAFEKIISFFGPV